MFEDINGYEDKLATDIERIKRAKRIINDRFCDRRHKEEAYRMLRLYRELAEKELDGEERERAKDILYELQIL